MTILVTGAAGGIGRAIHDMFAEAGETVLGQDVVASEVVPSELVGDLRDPAFLDGLDRHFRAGADPKLNAVVAAHGIAGAGRLNEITADTATRIMSVNFESVVLLWDRVKPQLEASNGVFVVIVSQAGVVAEAANGIYCASKFALEGWMQGLEAETNVRLRAIHPGGIRTPLLERALRDMAAARGITYEKLNEERYDGSPAGRVGEPKEVAELVRLLVRLGAPGFLEAAITGGEVLR